MPIDVSGFMPDNSQNPALYKMADTLERHGQNKREMDWRLQRQQEADEWKRLALIRRFTNIDDHHSGEGAMDALGDKKMADLITEFTLGGYSPNEIQAKLPQRVHQTISALDAAKNEYAQSDKSINEISKLYPGFLDTQSMREAHRKEILGRRLNPNGDFVNPSDVKPSKFDFSNPETLADFIPQDSDKVIIDELADPKLYETGSVMQGNRDANTTYKSRQSPFVTSTIKDGDFTTEGMLKNNLGKPGVNFKTITEDLVGEKREILSPEAYKTGFSQKANIAFIGMAKRSVPHWNDLDNDTKDKYIRGIAFNYVKSLDKSGYETTGASPPAARTTNNINMGYGGVGEAKGNLIDKINLSYYGNPQNGSIDEAEVKIIPADLQAVLKASGIDISSANYFKIEIENGKAVAITPEGGKRIDRVAIANAQKKFNTEGQKQTQPDFETVTPSVKQPDGGQSKPTKVDLKSLDPNGFKKEGKYWKYKDGRLFDDNGNLIKQ